MNDASSAQGTSLRRVMNFVSRNHALCCDGLAALGDCKGALVIDERVVIGF